MRVFLLLCMRARAGWLDLEEAGVDGGRDVFRLPEGLLPQGGHLQTHCVGNGLLRYFPSLQFDASVVSCKSASRTMRAQAGKRKVEGFEVVCKDTVLFPEGGGQVRNKSY